MSERTIQTCLDCGKDTIWEHGSKPCRCYACQQRQDEARREAGFADARGYTATQQLDMLCEILRNVNNGVMHINAANFDHAALDLEVAASKLRTLEKAKAV